MSGFHARAALRETSTQAFEVPPILLEEGQDTRFRL
jgi:hypothetical protein